MTSRLESRRRADKSPAGRRADKRRPQGRSVLTSRRPEGAGVLTGLERPLPDEPVLEDLEVRGLAALAAFEPGDELGYGAVGPGHAVGQSASDLVDDLAGGHGVLIEHLQKAVPVYAVRLDAGPGLDARGGPGLGEEAHLAHDGGRLDGGQALPASGEHPLVHRDGSGGDHVQPLLRSALLKDGLPRLEARRLQQLLQLLSLLVVQMPEERYVPEARRLLHTRVLLYTAQSVISLSRKASRSVSPLLSSSRIASTTSSSRRVSLRARVRAMR